MSSQVAKKRCNAVLRDRDRDRVAKKTRMRPSEARELEELQRQLNILRSR